MPDPLIIREATCRALLGLARPRTSEHHARSISSRLAPTSPPSSPAPVPLAEGALGWRVCGAGVWRHLHGIAPSRAAPAPQSQKKLE